MKGNFRTLFKRYCLESTVLGLKYFYLYPDWISRCFWLVTMLSIFSLACLLTRMLYLRFEQMPTRITIENQYELLQDLPYPSITICSPNQITISAVNHFNRTLVNGNLTHSSDIVTIIPQLLGFYQPIIEYYPEQLEQLQSLINLNRYTLTEVITLLPQSCDDFLKMCMFETKMYPHCRGLFHPILTTHGLCCTFNNVYYLRDGKRNERRRNPVKHLVKKSSLMLALSVIADYDPADALDGTVVNAGSIRVLYTDWLEFPADDVSTLVVTNAETYHAIHATYTYCSADVKQLNVASRKCYFEAEKKLRFFRDYHNSNCDHLCFVEAVEKACHCHVFHLPYLRLDNICNVSSLPCIMDVKMNMHKWLPSQSCDCPRDCESRRYSVDMSPGNFDALPYVHGDLYNQFKFNKSSSIMHFFFPAPVYVKQKQETVMSLISLASNLGGVFGLCIGCSAISVVEVLFYVQAAIRNYWRGRFKRHHGIVAPLN